MSFLDLSGVESTNRTLARLRSQVAARESTLRVEFEARVEAQTEALRLKNENKVLRAVLRDPISAMFISMAKIAEAAANPMILAQLDDDGNIVVQSIPALERSKT